MSNTIEIFVGSNGLDLMDFYPEDLPVEWRFDYYSSSIRAIALPFNTNEDLEEILVDIDEEFKLIINISHIENINKFLHPIKKYTKNFILFSNTINDKLLKTITHYNFCIESDKKIKNYHHMTIFGKTLVFNNFAVIFVNRPNDEKQIRLLIEDCSKFKKNIVLLQNNTDGETLEKTRIISELLGF